MRGITAVVVCALGACGGGDEAPPDARPRCPDWVHGDFSAPDNSVSPYCCGVIEAWPAIEDQEGCVAEFVDEFDGRQRMITADEARGHVRIEPSTGIRGFEGYSARRGTTRILAVSCQFVPCAE